MRSDAELVGGARRGEREAFVEIVARHQALVCGTAYGILNDVAASEDAAQEAFVTAWRKIAELRAPERLRPWLAQIARNAALGRLRAHHDTVSLEEIAGAHDPSPLPDESAASEEEAALVREQLARLPEKYRLPLVLFYRDGHSVRLVAEALDLSEDAVKQRLARGRALLRERMVGLIESTLTRTRPTALFTMAVATAIGALKAPLAIAASAFAATSATSATAGSATSAGAAASSSATATSHSIPALTAMATSHASIIVPAALVAVLCLPLGYSGRMGLEPDPPAADPPSSPPASAQFEPRDPLESWPDSSLLAEWKRLHATYGSTAESMPAIYDAIRETPDPFRRRALRSALVAEWAALDPAGGFAFFSDGDQMAHRAQIFEEWLARDPEAAVEGLLVGPKGWESLARDRLASIARAAPGRVAEIVARLPKPDGYWRNEVVEAFEIVAGHDLDEARAAAESLTGKNGLQALSGVGKAWGKSDADAALAWARALPARTNRDEVVRNVLLGLAEVSPAAALDLAGTVPPGGHPQHGASTTGARVLGEAAESDFEATVAWLVAHPERFGREDLMGMAPSVTTRLNADPVGFLNALAADGSLPIIIDVIGSALLKQAAGQGPRVWDWLSDQPDGPAVSGLKETVLRSAAWKDPEACLEMARQLSAPGDDKLLELIGSSIFNGRNRLHRCESFIAEVPEPLREPILKSAFMQLDGDTIGDPEVWIGRREALSAEARPAATQALARAWTTHDPRGAAEWVRGLPAGDEREAGLTSVAQAWSASDAPAASEWVASLPAGAERDVGARALAQQIAHELPFEAWQWATSVSSREQRLAATARVIERVVAGRERDAVDLGQWIEASPLSAGEKQAMRDHWKLAESHQAQPAEPKLARPAPARTPGAGRSHQAQPAEPNLAPVAQ